MGFNLFNFNNPITEKKIFIIGASTVRYDYDDRRVGWGTALCEYNMKNSDDCFNEGRRGATAENYKTMNETIKRTKGDAYWDKTKDIMNEELDLRGGFLLIQFGGNDNIQKVPKDTFMSEMKIYIDEARDFGVTPILITPVNARLKINNKIYDNRGKYPDYIKELAEQENVKVLDLHQKSLEEFDKLTTEELAQEFGAIEYSNGVVDLTHFNLHGAKIVANWVKELACQEDSALCKQFED
jgi:lysophospholipase L1-like esterase